MRTTPSDRRRSMRQLLFVIAGSHTGAFLGSALPRFGLPGDVFGATVVGVLLVLPVVIDAHWERVDPYVQKVMR